MRQDAGTSRSCSGRANGCPWNKSGRASMRLGAGISRCISGCVITAAQGDDTKPYFTVKLYKYSSQCPPPSAIAACFILRTAADTATHTSGMDAPSATSGDTGNPTVPAAAFVKYPKTPIE